MFITKWIMLAAVALFAIKVTAEESPSLKTDQEKVSYSMGVNIMNNFKQQKIDVNLDLLIKGLKDAQSGGKLLLTDEEMATTMTTFQTEMRKKQIENQRVAAEENKKAGDAFLAENKARDGVVTLPSGLQYKILKAGDGKKPVAADTVECNYRGTLVNGTEFDSSYKRGQPATFRVGGVIPGWQEALPLMPVGSKWQLFVPSQLAYGPRAVSRELGPNATLIFEIELLAIKPPAAFGAEGK